MEELTGLYYYRYRDYNPQTGRFLQPDSLGQLPGPNIYSYCSNNPVNWVDPWGMCREEDDFWSRWPDYVTDPEWVWDNIVEPAYNTLTQPGYNYGEWVYGEQNLSTFYGACLDSVWAVSVIYGAIGNSLTSESYYFKYNNDTVTVVHFTNEEGILGINNSGGMIDDLSYVTFQSEVEGLNAAQVEAKLGIGIGKGGYSTTFETSISNLATPAEGPFTSGGAVQMQLIDSTISGPFVPTP